MWIHEHPNWPNFVWDAAALASLLAEVRHHQGYLLGRMQGLGFALKHEASLTMLTQDVVKSSAIEGENLNRNEVRSSIARRLGMDIAGLIPAGRNVEAVVEMMLDATQQYAKPLTEERLSRWHAALFPHGGEGMHPILVAAWRRLDTSPMQVVSGPVGKERVHFEAPSADRLKAEMQMFLEGFEGQKDVDPILKAGMMHLWFVTIHPFEDGNGRIARALGDMALARADGMSERFYSLSSQIEVERRDYYNELERQQRATPDITGWLSWFLSCFGRAIVGADLALEKVLFKARFWDKVQQNAIHIRQRSVLLRMLEDGFEGHMHTSKYAKLAKCSKDTALRDIQGLKERGILIQNAQGGRSTSYRLPHPEELEAIATASLR